MEALAYKVHKQGEQILQHCYSSNKAQKYHPWEIFSWLFTYVTSQVMAL